jgi:tRNA (guanine-N7-)-methyltransferase
MMARLLCETVPPPPPAKQRGRRVRHHVNPLKADFLSTAPAPLALPPGEVEVELGCADARFLFERARQHPAVSCVGVEIRRELVRRVNDQARAEGLPNLVAIFANMNADMAALLPRGRVGRFFLNFPDPWFKRAQQKRRVVDPRLGAELRDLLVPGGELFFQSDIFDLALGAMEVLEQVPGLVNRRGEWSFCRGNPYGAESLREVRVQEKGLPVWRMLYARAG